MPTQNNKKFSSLLVTVFVKAIISKLYHNRSSFCPPLLLLEKHADLKRTIFYQNETKSYYFLAQNLLLFRDFVQVGCAHLCLQNVILSTLKAF